MEFNFTDISANPSIGFMDTKRCVPLSDDDSSPALIPDAALEPTHWLWVWLRKANAVLTRAERRVTENFRVPPNGA